MKIGIKSLLTLLCAAFFVACGSRSTLSKKQINTWYLSMEKTACFGTCPIYKLDVLGNKTCKLNAKKFMDIKGVYPYQLGADSLFNGLVQSSLTANWHKMDSMYMSGYTDLPATIIRYSIKPGDTTAVMFEANKAPEEILAISKRMEEVQRIVVNSLKKRN